MIYNSVLDIQTIMNLLVKPLCKYNMIQGTNMYVHKYISSIVCMYASMSKIYVLDVS
jgi:hypothetical protein